MKNNDIASAIIGTTFFAVPYLALSLPILPSVLIGTAAFTAGELVLKKEEKITLKKTNPSLFKTLENAKSQNKYISDMISKIDDKDIQNDLKEIVKTNDKIFETIVKKPEKVKKLKNFFEYYLPVTTKLVNKFDEIENQDISSIETNKFMETTGKTIKEINNVFKKMLNNLYQADMTDANVEIKVLNSMLKADGLDKDEIVVKEETHE